MSGREKGKRAGRDGKQRFALDQNKGAGTNSTIMRPCPSSSTSFFYLKCFDDVIVQNFLVEVDDGLGDALRSSVDATSAAAASAAAAAWVPSVVDRGRETMQDGLLNFAPRHDIVDIGGEAVTAFAN